MSPSIYAPVHAAHSLPTPTCSPAPDESKRILRQSADNELYAGLSAEEKARVAVMHSLSNSPEMLLSQLPVLSILGFGSNGCVLAATDQTSGPSTKKVAIKVIYKARVDSRVCSNETPAEIAILRQLSSKYPTSSILRYITDWEDSHHFYLVTEIFGSNWLAVTSQKDRPQEDTLLPLVFNSFHNGITIPHHLEIHSGSADMWAWSYAHRMHLFHTEGHSMLPLHPIRLLLQKIAHSLSLVHREGFYHGDVKIENILVEACSSGTGPAIRLADFGHARPAVTREGCLRYGTHAIAAPEFLRDSPYAPVQLDGRACDVFALGMVFYALLNEDGKLPPVVQRVHEGAVGYRGLLTADDGRYPIPQVPDLDAIGLDLLQGMLRVDPVQRLRIDEILTHAWFAMH
ncbi:kinase-like domain-containing protein [Chytriomyces sp. MP71]|nr:kinase-like domain-containing protein [Chytriomyces sp. MP71]